MNFTSWLSARHLKRLGLSASMILVLALVLGGPAASTARQLPSKPAGAIANPQAAANPPGPCCDVTSINAATGVVGAKVNSTGQSFQFKLTNQQLLQSLRVGQGVYANFTTRQVSLDGRAPSGTIIAIGPATAARPPVATPSVPSQPATAPKLPSPLQPAAPSSLTPAASITSIDSGTGLVSAKVNGTGQSFQFKLTNQQLLQSLKVGQGVYANFTTRQVSLDGKSASGTITSLSLVGGKLLGGPASAGSPSGSGSSGSSGNANPASGSSGSSQGSTTTAPVYSAASVAAVQISSSLVSECSPQYVPSNSFLDVLVGGCTFFVKVVAPTQPDTFAPAAPPAGAGSRYMLIANTNRAVTSCRDKNGATVDLAKCLKAAAYSAPALAQAVPDQQFYQQLLQILNAGSSSNSGSSGSGTSGSSSPSGNGSGSPQPPSTPALQAVNAAVDVLTASGTAAVPPSCGSVGQMSCANGLPITSTIQFTRNTVGISQIGASSYAFTASLSAATSKEIPVVISGVTCGLSVNTGSSPLAFTGTASVVASPGNTNVYKVTFSALQVSGAQLSDLTLSGGFGCSIIPSDASTFAGVVLETTLASRSPNAICVAVEQSGPSIIKCPN